MKKNYDILADLLKGIGIISVVIGHSGLFFPLTWSSSITAFVYLYHLMIFFFTAGILYQPQKYPDPYSYIGRQIKSNVPLFVGYNFLFLIFHNLFSRFHLIDILPYDRNDFIIQGVSILALKHTETICGTLWFVPMFLFSKAFFALGFQTAERSPVKWLIHMIIIIVTGSVGLYTSSCGMNLHFNIQTSLLGVPLIYLGYLFQRYRNQMIKLANPITCFVSFVLLCLFIREQIGFIDLAKNQIISIYWFYPITLLGITFCVSFAESIRRFKLFSALIAYIGSASFHIMALHFFVFKCFDLFIGKLLNVELATRIRFPFAFDCIGWLYSSIGIGIPLVLFHMIRLLKMEKEVHI